MLKNYEIYNGQRSRTLIFIFVVENGFYGFIKKFINFV
jgi:hypothetical protein